jgi:hypothetical protein
MSRENEKQTTSANYFFTLRWLTWDKIQTAKNTAVAWKHGTASESEFPAVV